MTDEEMADKYAKGLCKTCTLDTCRYNTLQTCAIKESLKQAYLAGFNAGRPKWHKVADGDLPKHCRYGSRTSEYVLAKFKSGNTGVCYFDFSLLGWFADGYPEQFKNIIAWCEIPKFKEMDK